MFSKVALGARLLLGLIFFVFGLNFFINFIPMPPPSGPMEDFFKGMMATRYFFPFLKGTEVVTGVLLLTNFFVPLALLVLAPVIINIVLVHSFLAPEGLPMALILVVLWTLLALNLKEVFLPLLKPKPS